MCFYQYANRLAHLYMLREQNAVDAFLVFIYFLNDSTTISLPVSRCGWDAAVALAKVQLGLPKSDWMTRYVKDVFIDTRHLHYVDWLP